MLGQEYYDGHGNLPNYETPTPPMTRELVEQVVEPTHAMLTLQKNPDIYAELYSYRGGALTSYRTGLKADGRFILAIKENNVAIGYTLRDEKEIFDYLQSTLGSGRAA